MSAGRRNDPRDDDSERRRTEGDKPEGLPPEEPQTEDKMAQARRLSAVAIYKIIHEEGREELTRPAMSLWWSGVAAGLGISASYLGEAVLRSGLEGAAHVDIVASLGYTLGFILVILSRLQLFTENTLTPILPLLARPSARTLWRTLRLWGIVLLANMVGTAATAAVTQWLHAAPDAVLRAMLEMARMKIEHGWSEALILGIPAGFFVAAIVWMLPSSRGFEIFTIGVFTYLIAAGGFSHVIVDSAKLFYLMLEGEIAVAAGIFGHILPTLIGNILGGTCLFAALAWAQVKNEVG